MNAERYRIRPVNRAFTLALLLVLVLSALLASYSAYSYQKDRILLQCDTAMRDLFDSYYQKVYHLSDVYIPIYQSEEDERLIRSYFECDQLSDLGYAERRKLVRLLDAMMGRDGDIEFILLYHPKLEEHFYLVSGSMQLQIYRGALPEGMQNADGNIQLLSTNTWIDPASGLSRNSFYLRGGAIPAGQPGGILIGYGTAMLDKLLRRNNAIDLAQYFITTENGLVYDSAAVNYNDVQTDLSWLPSATTISRDQNGNRWYIGTLYHQGREFTAAYRVPFGQLFRQANVYTPFILVILAAFAVFSFVIYMLSSRHIFRKVETIQQGLDTIGGNHLDYRLPVSEKGDEFDEISDHINRMTELLHTSVQKEYELVKRQTQAELNQIQARFDPHFLYNTLEVIRGKLFRNGDMETADYIEKLSRIFRNLTDAAPVTSIREEISFCSLYMSLLQLRYQDAVDIFYDIDADLQDLGILSHLIQPAIENYFMHALDENAEEHLLEIICEPLEENKIQIIIADNGVGSDASRIEEINARLLSTDVKDKGYGLMSIAKRIRLFYGEDYGVHLERNEPSGIQVVIIIPRMSIETHREKLGIEPRKG